MRTILVIGAGVCGAAAVDTLRREGFDGSIVLVGQEPSAPYERPPLSKEYLRGDRDREALVVHDEAWYGQRGIELLLGRTAVELRPADRSVVLDDGTTLVGDAVLLATGGRPITLPGGPSERILTLRTLEDADRIRSHLGPGKQLAVVGGGFIGTEVAATARDLDTEVTLVDMFDVPLQRALGPRLGQIFLQLHREHGVAMRMGERVTSVDERDGTVVVRSEAGAIAEADAAVVGVAIRPNVELAATAGLSVDDGILVDERCRSSVPWVFAAGDVARHLHPLFDRHLRVEHFDNALNQGAAAARAMVGRGEPYGDVHWFWSDQYDVNLQMAGHIEGSDASVIRGSLEERSFAAFHLKGGAVIGAVGLNRGRDVRRAMRLIAARARPDPEALRDEDVDLRRLIGSDVAGGASV